MKRIFNKQLPANLVGLSLLLTFLYVTSAQADTLTWNAAGGGVWNNAGNWSPSQIPVDTDTTVFSTVGSGQTNTFDLDGLSLTEMFVQQGTHTTDLNNNTLNMQTLRTVNANTTTGTLNFSGTGTVNVTDDVIIGTGDDAQGTVNAGANTVMNIGTNAANRASMTIAQTANANSASATPSQLISTGTFNAYLDALSLGLGARNNGRLNLTGASGLLDIDGLIQIGTSGRGAGELLVGAGMNVNIDAAGLVVAAGINQAGAGGGNSVVDLSAASGTMNVTDQIVIGRGRSMNGSMVVGSGVAFSADVSTLEVGRSQGNIAATGSLDLSAVNGGTFHVQDTVYIGAGAPAPVGNVTLGDGMNTSVGTAPSRASLQVGYGDDANGSFTLGAATFEGYLTELQVGSANGATDNNTQGTFDLSSATGGVLDVAGAVRIGASNGGTNVGGDAILANLTATANTVEISHTNTGGTNRGSSLELQNTTFAVSDAFTLLGVDATNMGQVLITTTASSSGLDFADAMALTVGNFGNIHIDFGTPILSEGIHWGLRWDGDHTTELDQLFTDGKLTWDDSNLLAGGFAPASIFLEDGVTYVGISVAPIPEPSSLLLLGLGLVCLKRRKR